MKNRLLFLIVIFIFISGYVQSQDQLNIEGYIYDEEKRPLPYASVFVQAKGSLQITASTQTNEAGFFKLNFLPTSESEYILKVSMLGYKSQEQVFQGITLLSESFIFDLVPNIIALKDIEVKARKDVVQQKDTVTFLADSFRDSTENNLEDLLQKIPGIDVEKSTGIIKVQGQPIKKILIDGDDLTGKNYQLTSKNLPANIVEQIEIISKFTDNPLLHGVEYSEDKALNITLKNSYKSRWTGNMELNAGTNKHYKAYGNLLKFNKLFKTLSFAGANNIGQNSISEQLQDEQFEGIDNNRTPVSIINAQNSWLKSNPINSISENQNTLFNQSYAGSSNLIAHIGKNIQTKFSFIFTHDDNQTFLNNDISYVFPDSAYKLREDIATRLNPVLLLGRLELKWKINPKSILKYEQQITNDHSFNTQETIANQNDIDDATNNNTIYWAHRLEYTYKLKEKLALLLESSWQKYEHKQDYETRHSNVRILPISLLDMFQVSSLYQNNYGITDIKNFKSTLYYQTKYFQVEYGLYVSKKEENFRSQLNAYFQEDDLSLNDRAKNNMQFIQKDYTTFLNTRYNHKSLTLFSNFLIGYYQADFRQGKNYQKLYILPALGIRREKNNHTLSGTYLFTTKMPQILDISSGERLTSYRLFEKGSSVLVPQYTHTGLLNYTFGNFEGNFLFYLNGLYTYQPRGYRSNWNISNDFDIAEKVENYFANQTSNILLGIEKYFPRYFLRIKLRPSIAQGIYQNNLNDSDVNRTNKVWDYKCNMVLKSGFLKGFNFTLGTNFAWQSILSLNTTIHQYNNNTYLNLHFKPYKKMHLNILQELITLKNSKTAHQKYYFLSMSFSYEIIKSKFSFNVNARNLTNTKEFLSNTISDFLNISQSIRLINRFVLIGASFKF